MTTIELKPKDFLTELLQALNELSGSTPNVALPWKDVADRVLQIKGYTLEDLGTQASSGQPNGYRWIQSGFRTLCKEGMGVSGGTGKWAISQAGIIKASAATPASPVAPPVEPDLPPSIPAVAPAASMPPANPTPIEEMLSVVGTAEVEEAPVEEAPVEEAPVEEAPVEQGRAWDFIVPPGEVAGITIDPYLLSLQTAAATCYGKFSDRSDLCRTCPIRLGCFEQIKTALFGLQEQIKLEEREAALAAHSAHLPATPKMSKPEPEPEPEPEPAPRPHTYDLSKAEDITATMETACVVCGRGVKQGTDCKWIPGVGVFHPDCL